MAYMWFDEKVGGRYCPLYDIEVHVHVICHINEVKLIGIFLGFFYTF